MERLLNHNINLIIGRVEAQRIKKLIYFLNLSYCNFWYTLQDHFFIHQVTIILKTMDVDQDTSSLIGYFG